MSKKILITAGPTQEMLDPVRFLSNLSTGKMGYTLAQVAKSKGYQVTLISGPTRLNPPKNVKFIPILSALELQRSCRQQFPKHDILIMTAAVCDFTARRFQKHKIHRLKTRELHLKRTPDIVAGLAKKKGRRRVIGFCLETDQWLEQAKRKRKNKHLDGIVANYYAPSYSPFGDRVVSVCLVDYHDNMIMIKKKSKKHVANAIIEWVENMPEGR